MTVLEKRAKAEFAKLSKKEQKRRNNLKRIAIAPPAVEFDIIPKPRKKKWDIETE